METSRRSSGSAGGFAVTILLSSFLIFQVQPLISKYILPWFGGTPGVWTTCMLFFQVVLFAGYAYAHLSLKWLGLRGQCALHLGLMGLALAVLPITPGDGWRPDATGNPVLQILLLLCGTVGAPYFVLSSTGPLVQAWFSRAESGTSPYRLYALSNVGSVLGLVTYPFLVEPALTTETQGSLWSWGFAAYVLCAALCIRRIWNAPANGTSAAAAESAPPVAAPPSTGDRWLWFALAACASVMLLATTNQVCLDVAVIPFLWVLPLTLYLVSFILCFDHERWYPRRTYAIALVVSMSGLCWMLYYGTKMPIVSQVVVHFTALFVCCMVCHGELVRLKPAAEHLTAFYLLTSAGGAAGGLFVGLAAPLLFQRFVELHWGMAACCLVTLIVFFRDQRGALYGGRPRWAWVCLVLAFLGLCRVLRSHAGEVLANELAVTRNFYGVIRVADQEENGEPTRIMIHGRILHGRQFLDPAKRAIPTAYYGEESGAGRLLRSPSPPGGRRVGLVGLGVGTLAAYGRAGDVYRFYEINPEVIRLAREHFTFLADSPATIELAPGDARLSLEREPPQRFDVLVLDAFSSDAIPAHLLTREAFEIYLRHLQPEGILAIHISNRHFNLRPVVEAAAAHFRCETRLVAPPADPAKLQRASKWMLVARDARQFAELNLPPSRPDAKSPRIRLWTDNYNNVVQLLK